MNRLYESPELDTVGLVQTCVLGDKVIEPQDDDNDKLPESTVLDVD